MGKDSLTPSCIIDTPQLIAENHVRDFDGDTYTCAKFGANPSVGASVVMHEI